MLDDLLGDETSDLHRTANTLINHTVAQLKPDAADILMYDANTRAFTYVAGHGFRTPGFAHSSAHRSLATQILRTSQRLHYSDLVKANPEWAHSQALMQEGFVGYAGLPMTVSGQMIGILETWQRGSFHPNASWWQCAEEIAGHGAHAVQRAGAFKQLKQAGTESAQTYDAMIEGWTRLLELRDHEPRGHSQRVTTMTVDLARLMGFPEHDLIHIRRGAMLHDVGKMGIPDSILLKPGSLTDDEWIVMRQHTTIAYEQLASIVELELALDIPYCHHENWDGSGYPRGLAGEKIPLMARLFALVDSWDSLRSDRPFRKAWPDDKVKAYILERGGKNFDPDLASKFTALLDLVLKKKSTALNPSAVHGYYASTVIQV